MTNLPKYFEVDFETYVKVYKKDGDVEADNQFGKPYPPVKALYDGRPITKDQFEAKRRAASSRA